MSDLVTERSSGRHHHQILATSMDLGGDHNIGLDSEIQCIIGRSDLIKCFNRMLRLFGACGVSWVIVACATQCLCL